MIIEKYSALIPLLTRVDGQFCLSVIMPFQPRMKSKVAIQHSIKLVEDKVKHELYEKCPAELQNELLYKLHELIMRLDYTSVKKSVALYVSPLVEQLYYLDHTVEEKIWIDSSFMIREVVRNKKNKHEFLLLIVSAGYEKIYVGNSNDLELIDTRNPVVVRKDMPEPVANFSNTSAMKETELKKFLHNVDNTLTRVLKFYPLPLLIMGPKKAMGYFQTITHHEKRIVGFVHGNFDDMEEADLLTSLSYELKNITALNQVRVVDALRASKENFKSVEGINNVWRAVDRKYKQVLVVENDFYCKAFVTRKGDVVFTDSEVHEHLITNDAVDAIIKMTIQNGGDVEFVDDLSVCHKIALAEAFNIKGRE